MYFITSVRISRSLTHESYTNALSPYCTSTSCRSPIKSKPIKARGLCHTLVTAAASPQDLGTATVGTEFGQPLNWCVLPFQCKRMFFFLRRLLVFFFVLHQFGLEFITSSTFVLPVVGFVWKVNGRPQLRPAPRGAKNSGGGGSSCKLVGLLISRV